MNIFGVTLSKPQGVDLAVIAFWGMIGGLIATVVLMPLIGGGWKHVVCMMVSAAIAGLAARCGASFEKAKWRGLLFIVVISTLGYALVAAIF